jgi:hypothetical protein
MLERCCAAMYCGKIEGMTIQPQAALKVGVAAPGLTYVSATPPPRCARVENAFPQVRAVFERTARIRKVLHAKTIVSAKYAGSQ